MAAAKTDDTTYDDLAADGRIIGEPQPEPRSGTAGMEVRRFRTAELHLYYRNPRKGDVRAIAKSLQAHGQYKPVVVNVGTHTGRPYEVAAGNHTLLGARELEWEYLHGVVIDVDEDELARIVAVDNRTSELGSIDDQALYDLLSALPDLDGTGYDPGDFDALQALLNESAAAAGDDEDVLRDSDEAAWPVIRIQVPPLVHERWRSVDAEDDLDRVIKLLNEAGR